MPTVLLTRPKEESERLATLLSAQGIKAVIEPLLTPVPSFAPRPVAGGVRALMLTSANALKAMEARREALADLMKRPVFCVGARTAATARAFGFMDVVAADGDGQALAARLRSALPPAPEPILHLCGFHVAGKAGTILQASGYKIVPWSVYKAVAAPALSQTTRDKLKTGEIEAALFFSPRTAAVFGDLLRQEKMEDVCRPMLALGLSEAVATPLRLLPFGRVDVAAHPSEDEMVSALMRAFSSLTAASELDDNPNKPSLRPLAGDDGERIEPGHGVWQA